MKTKQPSWKFVGHIGDVDPIAYGGAFIYVDSTGIYCPEMMWFDPSSDDVWNKLGNKTPITEYRILLERDSEAEWWYERLDAIACFTGQPLEELQKAAKSMNPLEKAWLYDSLIGYFGVENFDQSHALTMLDWEARRKYRKILKSIK
jgi:hypothetical protein